MNITMLLTEALTIGITLMAQTAQSDDDPALQSSPIIFSPGPQYADNARRWQGIPGIERAPNGRLWAVWYSGGTGEGPENYVLLVTSADDGKTWSAPVLVIDPPGNVRAYDPTLWHAPNGQLWLFWAQCWSPEEHKIWDGRAGVWAITTEDSGIPNPAWSTPRRICDGVMMNKPTVLGTGEWLLPAAIWSYEPGFSDRRFEHNLRSQWGSNVVVSTDNGLTWNKLGGAKVPKSAFDEHMIVERRDGSLWILTRTQYGIGESFSNDRGRTWTEGVPSSLAHPSARFFIRRMKSGILLLVKHGSLDQRTGRSHLTAFVSDDDGKTWQGGLILDERDGVSYPDGVEAPDGAIYIIYDFSRYAEREILMAVFTEQDILAGAPVTPKSRMRVLVNKAAGPRPEKR